MKDKIMKLFFELLKFGKLETEQGVLIYEGEALEIGMEVFIQDADGNIVAAPDGEYGNVVVAEGKVSDIKKEEEPEPAAEEPKAEEPVEQEEEPAAEEPKEPEAPAEDLQAKLDEANARIKELEAQLDEANAKIKELENVEMSKMVPAQQAVKDMTVSDKKAGALKYFNK